MAKLTRALGSASCSSRACTLRNGHRPRGSSKTREQNDGACRCDRPLGTWIKPNPLPVAEIIQTRSCEGGGGHDHFFETASVDDCVQIRVQHDREDLTALNAPNSLASEHMRIFPTWFGGRNIDISLLRSARIGSLNYNSRLLGRKLRAVF